MVLWRTAEAELLRAVPLLKKTMDNDRKKNNKGTMTDEKSKPPSNNNH